MLDLSECNLGDKGVRAVIMNAVVMASDMNADATPLALICTSVLVCADLCCDALPDWTNYARTGKQRHH